MTVYNFTNVVVWDAVGGNVKVARQQRVDVVSPTTGLAVPSLTQNGQPVSYLTSDDQGRVSFATTDVPVVRLVSPRGLTEDVPSNDLWSNVTVGSVPFAASGEVSTTKAVRADDARLSDARAPKLETTLGTSDLNTIITPGFYLQDQSTNATAARNYPQVAAGHLYVQAHSNTSFVLQMFVTHDTAIPNTYTRVKAGATWSPWQVRPTVNLAASTNLDTLTIEAAYRVVGFSTANSMTPALPSVATGLLEVFTQGGNIIQRWSTSGNTPNSIWQREKNGATWSAWRRLDMPVIYWEKDGNLATSTDLTTLTAGAWEIFSSTTASALNMPVAAGGVLEVFVVGTSGLQRYSTFGSPQQIWQRENNGGTWTAWRRLDAPPPTPTFSTSIPDYAAPRTHTWNPALCLYNGESDVLRRIRKAISTARHKGTGLRVVCIGDSKTVGAGITAGKYSETDSYPGQLVDLLSAYTGIIYAGNNYARWSANNGGWVAPAGYDTAYYQATSGTPASVTLTLMSACTGVKVYAQADATATISVAIDGGAPTNLTIPAGSAWTGQSITGLSDATHTLVITTSSTVRLMGVEQLYATPRLTITNAGRSGSDVSHWNDTATDKLWATNVTAANPDLLIVNLGTNTGATTPPDIVAVIARAASLGIPVLVAAFGGIARSTLYDGKRDALYDAADTYDLPLVDFTVVIGDNTTATAAGLMTDSLHENERGYALEAAAVARVASL